MNRADRVRRAFIAQSTMDIVGLYGDRTEVQCRKCGKRFTVGKASDEYIAPNYGHECDVDPPVHPAFAELEQ